MGVLTRQICRTIGHRPDRRAKWYDKINWRTHCARCRTPLIRMLREWQEFDTRRHLNPRRRPHPDYDRSN
jgi:hypothetical protein